MKKVITSILCTVALISSSALWANKDIKGSNPLFRKNGFSANLPSPTKRFLGDGGGGECFGQGKFALSFGYGFPNLGKAVVQAIIDASNNPTDVKSSGVGPLHFRAEYGLSDNVGFAASVNYVSAGVKWTSMNDTTFMVYSNSLSRSSVSVLARLNFHFSVSDKVDPYFGFGAGYKGVTWSITSNDPDVSNYSIKPFSPFGFETTIGVRYYLTEGIGLYTELGLAKSLMQVGLVAAF